MAMLEQHLFEGGVAMSSEDDIEYEPAGGIAAAAAAATAAAAAGAVTRPAGSSRHRLRANEPEEPEACAQCGETPGAILRANTASLSTASDASSGSRRGGAGANANSNSRRESRSDTRADGPVRSESPIVGMRGGLARAGGAAEPIRGLAAFGSQTSLRLSQSPRDEKAPTLMGRGGGGGGGGSRRPSPKEGVASSDPAPNACTCQQGRVSSRGRSSGGGSGSRSQGDGGGNSSSIAKPTATRSNSPYRGDHNGATSGSRGAPPPRDPGYRVLQWSELSNLTYMTMGAMCEIHSAELDGVRVAVKVPRKDCEEPAIAEHDLEVELDVLKRVSHKHIIGLVGAGMREEKPNRFLVLEFLELGTLADKLDGGSSTDGTGTKESTFLRRQKRTKRYQDFYMVTMLERSLELAMALEHLHHHMPETFVVHRDLKPDNVGFKADGTLKLFDFGLARVVKRRNRVNARYEMTGETGSMRYMAPEVVESLPYNEKVDVYAFGLLLWEMLEDRRVFDGMGVTDFYERVVNAGARPNLDPAWPQDLRKLISQCWHADVDRRPNFRVIAERLRDLYQGEKHSSKLCMSALNLNEDEHPKLRGGSSVNMLVRSATTTNVNPRGVGGGPSSRTEIGNKKGGMLRRSFSKMGRMLNPKKGGAKPTLTHTAPEAYTRNSLGVMEHMRIGENPHEYGNGDGNGGGASQGLDEASVYGEGRMESARGSGGGGSAQDIRASRAQSDGMILKFGAPRRR